jgi:hypothetical protein
MLNPTADEQEAIEEVRHRLLAAIAKNETIRLPDFDPELESGDAEFALLKAGLEPNPWGGSVGDYRYQFEGEDDLLHLMVCRRDCAPLSPEQGQSLAALIFPTVPPALYWFKPGTLSQHFYIGHDVLPDYLS